MILKDKDQSDLDFDAFDPRYHRPFDENVKILTWNQRVRAFFTWNNAQCMSSQFINLTSYDDVSGRAGDIYKMVSEGKMPPGDPWPQDQIDLFKEWRDNGCAQGDSPDTDKPDTLIMDPPLRYKFDPPPDIANFNRDINPLFTYCDQKIAVRDYNSIDVKQYEQFKKAANDYNNNKENKSNIVYDIFHDNFPQGNRWPQIWKTVLTNWIDNGFQEGEITIYDDPA